MLPSRPASGAEHTARRHLPGLAQELLQRTDRLSASRTAPPRRRRRPPDRPVWRSSRAWVSGGLPVPNSAVPVLAPMGSPGRSARNLAVPSVTTARIMSRRASASTRREGAAGSALGTGRSGRSLGTTALPSATDAATAAMAIGEARTLPCPISEAACSVADAGTGTCPKKAGKPRSWSTPSPRAAAASARSWSPVSPRAGDRWPCCRSSPPRSAAGCRPRRLAG